MGLLGFCINFILSGKERGHWIRARRKPAGGKQGGVVWLCPVGLCPYHILSWGSISHLWGAQEGTPDPLSQRRDRTSSCARQHHVI